EPEFSGQPLARIHRHYSPFKFKRARRFLETLSIAPDDAASRVDRLFTVETPTAIGMLEALVRETLPLIEQHLPEADTTSSATGWRTPAALDLGRHLSGDLIGQLPRQRRLRATLDARAASAADAIGPHRARPPAPCARASASRVQPGTTGWRARPMLQAAERDGSPPRTPAHAAHPGQWRAVRVAH